MHDRFERRITEGLEALAASCQKRVQSPIAMAQRVGRLLGSNSRAAKLFQVEVGTDEHGAATVQWTMAPTWRDWARLSEGCYVLRSNLVEWTVEDLWTAYIHLTDAELAFRIQKSDLELRPIWHQKETRVQAYILVCFLAYVLWKTLARWCQAAGLGEEPRKVFAELSQIRLVDVVLPTRSGIELRKRCVSRPTEHQAIVLQRLGLTCRRTWRRWVCSEDQAPFSLKNRGFLPSNCGSWVSETDIAAVLGISERTLGRWMSGDTRYPAERQLRVIAALPQEGDLVKACLDELYEDLLKSKDPKPQPPAKESQTSLS
jgi:hypothetical protein